MSTKDLKEKIEEIKKELETINNLITDEVLENASKEELEEYIKVAEKLKARLDLLS